MQIYKNNRNLLYNPKLVQTSSVVKINLESKLQGLRNMSKEPNILPAPFYQNTFADKFSHKTANNKGPRMGEKYGSLKKSTIHSLNNSVINQKKLSRKYSGHPKMNTGSQNIYYAQEKYLRNGDLEMNTSRVHKRKVKHLQTTKMNRYSPHVKSDYAILNTISSLDPGKILETEN